MQRLWPLPTTDVTPYESVRPDRDGPLVRLNMVLSADGRAADGDGRSGGLGGDADMVVFRALRAHADAILVGAGTARDEGYGPHRIHPSVADQRRADGRVHPARMVLVTRSADLDYRSELFTRAEVPTTVVTCASAPADRRAAAEAAGEVIVAGDDDVDLVGALAQLRERGCDHVLAEGGPGFNAALIGAGLLDELTMTLAPVLAGGDGPAMVEGMEGSRDLDLIALHTADDHLFCRYRTRR